jgi:hypothetical protein
MAFESTGIRSVEQTVDQARLGFGHGVDAVGGLAKQPRSVRVAAEGGLCLREQQPGGREPLPFLRRPLLADRDARRAHSEDKEHGKDRCAAAASASIAPNTREKEVPSPKAQLDAIGDQNSVAAQDSVSARPPAWRWPPRRP